MITDQSIDLLRALADEPAEVIHDAGAVLFRRHGKEYELTLRNIAGVGIAVESDGDYEPLETYCQKHLLNLQNLAKQLCLSLEAEKAKRPGGFIEAGAELQFGSDSIKWTVVSKSLEDYLLAASVGFTTIVEVTARAGQGKTVLLEEMALRWARKYMPQDSPLPILLPVDLLGRFVGSIDDAIAGELANRYLCPGLTQRDVVECLRRRWLILALDGFDELASRIGVREAFLRLGELGDQLKGEGTVLLAARDSFFELFQVESAITKYLQPRSGSYSRVAVRLAPWSEEQGLAVFREIGSSDPEGDLSGLLKTFQEDRELVYHPFFLTRLAKLWQQGARFEGSAAAGRLERTKYVVESFIERESQEKWVRPGEGELILRKEEHAYPLGSVAEEMWRSSVTLLDEEEIRLAGEVGLLELQHLPRSVRDEVIERLPTHCAFVVGRDSISRRYTFIHQRFFHYFLAHRIALLARGARSDELKRILAAAELDPEITRWITWFLAQNEDPLQSARIFGSEVAEKADELVRRNAGSIVARVVERHSLSGFELRELAFGGEDWQGTKASGLVFEHCSFWETSFEGTRLENCRFVRCTISSLRVDRLTRLSGSVFEACEIGSVRGGRLGSLFAPREIEAALRDYGGRVENLQDLGRRKDAGVSKEFIACTERVVRRSVRSTPASRIRKPRNSPRSPVGQAVSPF